MAITNGYVTLANFKEYAIPQAGIDTDDDGIIEIIIEAACRYVDQQMGRQFYTTTEDRNFDVPSGRILWIEDDFIAVNSITNGDGTSISSDEYNMLPANKTPKYAIKLKESSTVIWEGDSDSNYEQVITLNCDWGYSSSVPKDIEMAVYEIAKSAYHRKKGENLDSIARVTNAGVLITPRDVSNFSMGIINVYRRRT